MNCQQAHGVQVHCSRRLQPTRLQCPHKGVRRGVTPAVDLQGRPQKRPQVGQHGCPTRRWSGRSKSGQHIALGVNSLQCIMRRQGIYQRLVLHEYGLDTNKFGRKQLIIL